MVLVVEVWVYTDLSRRSVNIGPSAPTFWWWRYIVSRRSVNGPSAPTFWWRRNIIFIYFHYFLGISCAATGCRCHIHLISEEPAGEGREAGQQYGVKAQREEEE